MRSYGHCGRNFEVWNRRESWFWAVVDRRSNRGSIGAAISEAEAIREATESIEESSDLQCRTVLAWNAALANLAGYLGRLNRSSGECVR